MQTPLHKIAPFPWHGQGQARFLRQDGTTLGRCASIRVYSRRRIRNERVNVAYFTPMKTARIITGDRGRTRKFSAVLAVDGHRIYLLHGLQLALQPHRLEEWTKVGNDQLPRKTVLYRANLRRKFRQRVKQIASRVKDG